MKVNSLKSKGKSGKGMALLLAVLLLFNTVCINVEAFAEEDLSNTEYVQDESYKHEEIVDESLDQSYVYPETEPEVEEAETVQSIQPSMLLEDGQPTMASGVTFDTDLDLNEDGTIDEKTYVDFRLYYTLEQGTVHGGQYIEIDIPEALTNAKISYPTSQFERKEVTEDGKNGVSILRTAPRISLVDTLISLV